MQIILSKYSGYCAGVKRVVDLCEDSLKKNQKVKCLHPLIHNRRVIDDLSRQGLSFASEESLTSSDTLIINAHGATKQVIDLLKNKNVNVIDGTCPFVKRVQEKAAEYANKGYKIIIFGNQEHSEIKALISYCKNYQVVDDWTEIDFSENCPYLVLSQTTYNAQKIEYSINKLNLFIKNNKKIVEFFDSLCYTTLWRQLETSEIAKKADFMLIIGDKTSANCKRLFEISSRYCQQTYFIESVSDLKSVHIDNSNAVLGIASGASTPKELIMEVFYIMSEIKATEVNEVTPVVENTVETNEENVVTMEQAMKKYSAKSYHEGMRITAKVVSADQTGISVAIEGGGKNDSGFITKEEAEIDGSYDPNNYKPNDEIRCVIIPKDNSVKSNYINLSKKAYDAIRIDDEHVQRILQGEEFTLNQTQEVKGGLLGKIGTYTIFIPASQIRIGFVKNLADYTNKTLRLVALPPKEEVDEEGNPVKRRNTKRIVASQRVILEKEKAEKDEEFWSKIYVGAIVNGKVKRYAEKNGVCFGAFVSLKYMDALVRCADMSWSKKRITDPSEILELNKSYDFIVLSADRENGKISLGYKQLQKKPYEIAQEKYPVGTVVEGKVARIVKFGAFIELEPGIDGLVHISQIKRGWIENAAEALTEGQIVKVKVMGYENDKITLSIKELLPEEPVAETKPVETNNNNDAPVRGKKRKVKEVKEEDNEPREYVSDNHGVTLGDLFAHLNATDDSSSKK